MSLRVYRVSKAGVCILTETIAGGNLGVVRTDATMPSLVDTPATRGMLSDTGHGTWPSSGGTRCGHLVPVATLQRVTSGVTGPRLR
jgi:hypothetical protein